MFVVLHSLIEGRNGSPLRRDLVLMLPIGSSVTTSRSCQEADAQAHKGLERVVCLR